MGDARMSNRPKRAKRLWRRVRVVDRLVFETLPHSGQVIGRSPDLVRSYQHFGQRCFGRPRKFDRSQNHDLRRTMSPRIKSVMAIEYQIIDRLLSEY